MLRLSLGYEYSSSEQNRLFCDGIYILRGNSMCYVHDK